jgi:hypothetical protein
MLMAGPQAIGGTSTIVNVALVESNLGSADMRIGPRSSQSDAYLT